MLRFRNNQKHNVLPSLSLTKCNFSLPFVQTRRQSLIHGSAISQGLEEDKNVSSGNFNSQLLLKNALKLRRQNGNDSLLNMKWDNNSHTFVPSYRFSNDKASDFDNLYTTQYQTEDSGLDLDTLLPQPAKKKRIKHSMLLRKSSRELSAANDDLIQSFLASLNASDIPRAKTILESMIETGLYRYQLNVQEDCFIILLRYSFESITDSNHSTDLQFLKTASDLLRFYLSLIFKHGQTNSYPYKALAFILHCACKISSYEERVVTILRLESIWKKEFKLCFDSVSQNTDMLDETDIQIIELVLRSKKEDISLHNDSPLKKPIDNFLKDFNWRTSVGNSLDEVLQSDSFNVKSIFGENVYRDCSIGGQVNYLKLYNVLYDMANGDKNSPLLMKFERLFDTFNRRRQYDMEMKFKHLTVQRAKSEAGLDDTLESDFGEFKRPSSYQLQNYVFQWKNVLSNEIKLHLGRVKREKEKVNHKAHKDESTKSGKIQEKLVFKDIKKFQAILEHLGPARVAEIVTMEMVGIFFGAAFKADENSFKFKRTVAQLSRTIGERIETAESHLRLTELSRNLLLNTKQMNLDNHNQTSTPDDHVDFNVLKLVQTYSTGNVKNVNVAAREYSKMVGLDHVALGATMITLALGNLKFRHFDPETGLQTEIPAFLHTKEFQANKLVGIIQPDANFLSSISKNSKILNQDVLTPLTLSKVPPMLVKPKPWDASLGGGYWYTNLPTLGGRPDEAPEQYSYVMNAIKHNMMDRYIGALNSLSQCAWAVNPKMLDVLLQIWNSGRDFLDIPGLDISTEPDNQKAGFQKNSEKYHKQSHRLSLGYILRLAGIFGKNGDRFYYPYRIDFRGRVYPLSNSGFWHVGPDHVRSLFMFWYGKPLGKTGFKWLKVHLANMYGVDKVNRQDQIKFVDDHWEEIVDSAKNPIKPFGESLESSNTFGMWWAKADKPFQALAACFELVSAVESGDPESFVSRLCVAQDGTCNGLQHYAALGRDIKGATEVNLVPCPNVESGVQAPPRDIYSKVRDLVIELAEKDITTAEAAGILKTDEKAQLAMELRGHITRKIVKRPVMTSVYGVTRFGTSKQIEEELKQNEDLDSERIKLYRGYLTEKIFEAYSTLFSKAELIQRWLEDCSSRICESVSWDNYGTYQYAKSLRVSSSSDKEKFSSEERPEFIVENSEFMKKFMTSVVWTTPLGLPVVQPYRRLDTMEIVTPLQRITVFNPNKPAFIVKSRQINGIAPNYIHSLDSTHLLMTAEEMHKRNMTFASVHDSFWTHAADVNTLSRVLRRKFVELYQPNLIEQLYNEWKTRYDGYLQLVYVNRHSEAGKRIQKLRESNWKETQIFNKGMEWSSSSSKSKRQITETNSLRHELLMEYQNWRFSKETSTDTVFKENVDAGKEKQNTKGLKMTPSMIIKELKEPVYRSPDTHIVYGDTVIGKQKVSTLKQSSDNQAHNYDSKDMDYQEQSRINRLSKNRILTSEWMPVFVPIHIPKPPERGDLDIELVKTSLYFFK